MFCTTECWNCEDIKCENYISKQELFFDNQLLKSVIVEIRDVLNNQMDYREFVDVVNAIEEILDKVVDLC